MAGLHKETRHQVTESQIWALGTFLEIVLITRWLGLG